MKLVRSVAGVREVLMAPREEAMRIGLVPTMGAFHEGHLTLFRSCAAECDVAVASLFVNPAQFGPGEDLERYPRGLDRDTHLAEEAGIDLLFAPGAEEIYPPGFQTAVEVGELGQVLEGASRPGHFRGVATVCLKLFNIVQPAVAYFGRKDAQQAAVIGTMLRDLNLPIELRVIPIVRDADGLALSSRNAYLQPDERRRALALPRALQAGLEACRAGGGTDAALAAAQRVLAVGDGIEVDYLAVADLDGPTLAGAIRVGSTRLIDNVLLDEEAT
ncbi:MAG: pantoate--beta-alanine ligase [Chloroflexi bacterium]|nr:MAG: pantoate--beta-alanine ligase [Chloroflexota bacterium]